MPLHPAIGIAKGHAGFASWWSAARVGRVGRSGESMLHAIHKVVNSCSDEHDVGRFLTQTKDDVETI